MTSFTILLTRLRPAAVLVMALGLASCGGKASFPINGTVSGLQYNGLVLTTNGMDVSVPATATSATTAVTFSFPNSISYGEVYNVTQKTPPAHQSCSTISPLTGVDTASNTAGRIATISITVTCSLVPHAIGGTVTGLTAGTLVLTNGTAGGTATIVPATVVTDPVVYAFPTQVAYNTSYGITVLSQPAGKVCTVSNATGVMGDDAITNINVTCV